jgi:hypothetical protein
MEDPFQLKQHFESIRFTIPFIVYKIESAWGVIDTISLYLHVVTNSIILFFAI